MTIHTEVTAIFFRPSGLEPPPGLRRTRPSNSFAHAICVRPRPDRPFCGVCGRIGQMTCVRDVSRQAACVPAEPTSIFESLLLKSTRLEREHIGYDRMYALPLDARECERAHRCR